MVDKPLWAKMLYTRALGTPYVRGKPVVLRTSSR